jgi:hypothetical protein
MLSPIVTYILTSAGVSAFTTLALQTYLKSRIQYHFDEKMAKYKSELEVQAHIRKELVGRRVQAYPKIIELCNITRNMARDLVLEPGSTESIREFAERVRELEELIYASRRELEADHLWKYPPHDYKALLKAFLRNYLEPLPVPDRPGGGADASHNKGKAYAEIDKCYSDVVERLTRDTSSTA